MEILGINSRFTSEELVSNKSVVKKFQNHPSRIKIKQNHQGHFGFSAVGVEDVDTRIALLDASKAIQQNDIPVKTIKANRDTFLNLLCMILTKVSLLQDFLTFSKGLRLNQVLRKNLELIKKITDLSAFYL